MYGMLRLKKPLLKMKEHNILFALEQIKRLEVDKVLKSM